MPPKSSSMALNAACRNDSSTLTLADSRLTHTSPSASFTLFAYTTPFNDSTFVMVVRCFYVNNSLFSTQAQWAVPFSTFVACNTCAAQVDCFTPYSAGLAAGVYPACSCNCAHRPSIASLNCLPTYYSTSMTQSATGGGVSSTNTASKTRSVGTRARSGSASTSPGLHSRTASSTQTVSTTRHTETRSSTVAQSMTRSLTRSRSAASAPRSSTASATAGYLSLSSSISLTKYKPK